MDSVGTRSIEGGVEVDMTVVEAVEHGGAERKKAVGFHGVGHFRAEGIVDSLPVHLLDVEHGVLLVDPLPKVVEGAHRIATGFVHEGLLTARCEEKGHEQSHGGQPMDG